MSIYYISRERCMVDYFQLYLDALCNTGPFYRRPLPPSREINMRYSQQPVGVIKLKTLMETIAQKGQRKGNFTYRSRKRTCATQMYIAGVSEQEQKKSTKGCSKLKSPETKQLRGIHLTKTVLKVWLINGQNVIDVSISEVELRC